MAEKDLNMSSRPIYDPVSPAVKELSHYKLLQLFHISVVYVLHS